MKSTLGGAAMWIPLGSRERLTPKTLPSVLLKHATTDYCTPEESDLTARVPTHNPVYTCHRLGFREEAFPDLRSWQESSHKQCNTSLQHTTPHSHDIHIFIFTSVGDFKFKNEKISTPTNVRTLYSPCGKSLRKSTYHYMMSILMI